MYWTEFLTVALIHLLAVASPGPDFAVVVRESVTHGRRAGMFTAFGVGTAIFVHVGYSLLGIGIIVSQSIVLFNALKWLAAAYLLYIGIKALRAKPADPAALAASLPVGERTARAVVVGAVFQQVIQTDVGGHGDVPRTGGYRCVPGFAREKR